MVRMLLALSLAALASSAPLAAQTRTTQMQAVSGNTPVDKTTQTEDVKFRNEYYERMTVPVLLGGAGPYRFLVDTGADRTAISRQLASRDPLETERSEEREQLVRVARRRGVEVEGKLAWIGPAGEERLQRAKHFTGPATKSRSSADQSMVETSMSASVILMLFTDDGRPPRDRLLIVPDVEMIVPRFVCSM